MSRKIDGFLNMRSIEDAEVIEVEEDADADEPVEEETHLPEVVDDVEDDQLPDIPNDVSIDENGNMYLGGLPGPQA